MSDTPTKTPVTGHRLLPKGFSPSVNEVIIGRGRKVTNHSGNERFRELIYSEIKEYAAAENKTAKSAIIFRVLQQVKNGSPNTGGFVKQDSKTKRWYAVEDATGRTTTAQAFRDALSSSYKSSKQFKQQRRWDRRSTSTPSDGGASNSAAASKEETPAAAVSGDVEILPKLPVSFSAFAGLPSLEACPQGPGTGSQLGDILNSALETVEDMAPFPTLSNMDLPPTCGEKKCTKEVDLDRLVDLLGVQPTTSNPFEPTPISPAFAAPTPNFYLPPLQTMPQLQSLPPLQTAEPKEEKDHCGHCWETKIQGQILDDSFWQDSGSDQTGSGFSLKHALTSCRQCPL